MQSDIFDMIKQKPDNEHMEKSILRLKRSYYYCIHEKLSARYEWYKTVAAELSKYVDRLQKSEGLLSKPKLERNSSLRK